jgi:type I restriction enzyme S subunit
MTLLDNARDAPPNVHVAQPSEPWPLPVGWRWVRLRDVVEEVQNTDPKRLGSREFAYIDVSSVNSGMIVRTKRLAGSVAPSRARQLVRFGDTLLSSVRVYLKNIAMVGREHDGAIASTAFCVLRPNAVVDPRFLFWFVNWQRFTSWLIPLQRGNSPPAVLDRDIKALPIPVPPTMEEQRRIVARIDELFAEIAEGEAALARARQDLDTWRRSLLKAAVTGELTSDWREANPSVGSGADIVSRIRRLPNEGGRRRASQGKLTVDRESLPQLPASWVWAPLGELGEIVGGVTVDKKRAPADPVEVPYLRVANVQRGLLDLTEVKTIRVERSVAARLALRGGDILLNEGGDRDKIGRGCVWREELPTCIHQNHVFRVRLRSAELNPLFISHYANEMGRRFFMEKGKQTTNLASISLTKISELPVPVPPAAEVNEIMRRLATLMESEVDNESYVNTALESVKALKQSVLKAAFEGRLGTSDAADRRVTRDTRTPAATTMALRQPIRAKA